MPPAERASASQRCTSISTPCTPSARRRSRRPARTRCSSPGAAPRADDADDQAAALLDDLELDDVAVAGHDGELHGHDGDRAPAGAREPDDVLGAPVDALDAPQRAPAAASQRRERHRVGHLEADQRLDAVGEVGHQQPGARRAVRHGAAVLVDVLDDDVVLEEVQAVVALAFGAPEALGRRVEVERPHAERLLDRGGRLGRAQLAAGRHPPQRQAQPAGRLLLGQQHGHRRVDVEEVRPEAVERLDELRHGQRDRQREHPVQAHVQGLRPAAAHVRAASRRRSVPCASAGCAAGSR